MSLSDPRFWEAAERISTTCHDSTEAQYVLDLGEGERLLACDFCKERIISLLMAWGIDWEWRPWNG